MLKNAKIGVKLSVGFGILIVVILVISALAIQSLTTLNQSVKKAFDIEFEKVVTSTEMLDHVNLVSIDWLYIPVINDPRETVILQSEINENVGAVSRLLDKFDGLITTPEGRRQYEVVLKNRVSFRDIQGRMAKALEDNDTNKLLDIMQHEYKPSQRTFINSINDLNELTTGMLAGIGVAIEKKVNTTLTTTVLIAVIGLVISIILAVMITKMITSPLQRCLEVANNLSKGNTNVDIEINSHDETGVLAASMQNMVKSIQEMYADVTKLTEEATGGHIQARADHKRHAGDYAKIIKGINGILDALTKPISDAMSVMNSLSHKDLTARMNGHYKGEMETFKDNINTAATSLEKSLQLVDMGVDQITSASSEISTGSQMLAEATSENASALEEVSSSLEEINSLTASNAENAREGLKLADLAVQAVDAGNVYMEKMNKAMDAIMKSSQETGKIIKTIDEIAFQTNLLALNAAVEAAHAGDAGKGFAVVAEEVKNLAQRSAAAASDTNALIEEATKNSQVGTEIVQQVTTSFLEMKEQFNKVKSIVNEISVSSNEQSHGVNQINVGISEMNRVTQQNAANAEQSASAAEELRGQAGDLKQMVNEFKISRDNRVNANVSVTPTMPKTNKQIPYSKKPAGYEVVPEKVLPLDSLDDDMFNDF